jgi:hypothetical protein
MGLITCKFYLGNTFSPMMLRSGDIAEVSETTLSNIPNNFVSIVSHEVTAKVLSALLNTEIEFNRINLTLISGDILYCIIPNFRSSEAREFTYEEVTKAGYRVFLVIVK